MSPVRPRTRRGHSVAYVTVGPGVEDDRLQAFILVDHGIVGMTIAIDIGRIHRADHEIVVADGLHLPGLAYRFAAGVPPCAVPEHAR
jgi:hypothetical protein